MSRTVCNLFCVYTQYAHIIRTHINTQAHFIHTHTHFIYINIEGVYIAQGKDTHTHTHTHIHTYTLHTHTHTNGHTHTYTHTQLKLIINFIQSQGQSAMPVDLLVKQGYTPKPGYEKLHKAEKIRLMQVLYF